MTDPLRPGDRISNYLLDERIAAGTFGEVWKAHHHVFNDVVAVKVPTDPQYVRNLQREGMAVHGLRHPNIVRALDLDPYATPPYLIIEYVDGPSLRQLIEENRRGLPTEAVAAILHGTLAALSAAHEAGIIHRDIKPENILIGGGFDLAGLGPQRVRVTDFGLGRLSEATAETMFQSGSIATETGHRITGTLAYMAPEQRDGRPVDPRSDLYAVGVVLHEMLTGELPQGTDLPGETRDGVPGWMDDLFARSYTRLDRRFASATEMRAALERHWRPSGAGAVSPPLVPPGAAERKRRAPGGQVQCRHCGRKVRPEHQFCIHCGQQLVENVARCGSCQAFVGPTDNFCIMCGADLRKRSVAGPPTGTRGD